MPQLQAVVTDVVGQLPVSAARKKELEAVRREFADSLGLVDVPPSIWSLLHLCCCCCRPRAKDQYDLGQADRTAEQHQWLHQRALPSSSRLGARQPHYSTGPRTYL